MGAKKVLKFIFFKDKKKLFLGKLLVVIVIVVIVVIIVVINIDIFYSLFIIR